MQRWPAGSEGGGGGGGSGGAGGGAGKRETGKLHFRRPGPRGGRGKLSQGARKKKSKTVSLVSHSRGGAPALLPEEASSQCERAPPTTEVFTFVGGKQLSSPSP